MSDLPLDTCALLWLAEGVELTADAPKATVENNLNVSPIYSRAGYVRTMVC